MELVRYLKNPQGMNGLDRRKNRRRDPPVLQSAFVFLAWQENCKKKNK
jgi:hypothetical protein